MSDDRYIYWGKDAGSNPLIVRLDTVDDSISDVFNWPCYIQDPNTPYRSTGNFSAIFGMLIHDNVYYAAIRSAVAPPYSGAILASLDGEHWAVAYRTESLDDSGFRDIVGYMGGYLWGSYMGVDYGDLYMYRMKPVKAKNVSALRLEKGITNLLEGLNNSSFESEPDWYYSPNPGDVNDVASGITTDESIHGSHSYKLVLQDNDAGSSKAQFHTPYFTPSEGQYLVASFWVKGAPTWPEEFSIMSNWLYSGGSLARESSIFRVFPYWQRIVTWARVEDDNWDAGKGVKFVVMFKYINDGYGSQWQYSGDWSNATCYIDAVQIVAFDDLHYYGSFHPGGNIRADESGIVPLTGIGDTFSISFEWKPNSSSRELHRGQLSIASILGLDNSFINLAYDKASQKFILDNGIYSVFTDNTYTWEHQDYFRFAITSDGVNSKIYLESSLNAGESLDTPSVSLTDHPVLLQLNTDFTKSNFGHGLFHSIRAWNVVLSPEEIGGVFDLP